MQTFASTTKSEHTSGMKTARSAAGPEAERHDPVTTFSSATILRKVACACGGCCPACQASSRNLKISQPNDPAEIEADQIAVRVMRMPSSDLRTRTSQHDARLHGSADVSETLHRKCDKCEEEDELETVQRKAPPIGPVGSSLPQPHVREALSSAGQPLDHQTRAFFEPRLGYDLSSVRVHTDPTAAESARAVEARAYTFGSDIVFAEGEFHPSSESGHELLAHELAHVVQGGTHTADKLQRTPASKVSCANRTPLVVPGTGLSIADPVAVITAAEDRANEMFDAVIDELDFTLGRIRAGATIGWPTIADPIAEGLRLMGLDPDDPAVWNAPDGTGRRSVPLLLRRLRLIRGTIGAGSFFFFCLGTGMRTIGTCAVTTGDICTGAVLTTCAGEFLTAMCPDFWGLSPENQAARIVHESAHNFANFIGHTGRFTNAECFARLVQVYAGVPVAEQRLDLCPDS